jgi:hypothetical protein
MNFSEVEQHTFRDSSNMATINEYGLIEFQGHLDFIFKVLRRIQYELRESSQHNTILEELLSHCTLDVTPLLFTTELISFIVGRDINDIRSEIISLHRSFYNHIERLEISESTFIYRVSFILDYYTSYSEWIRIINERICLGENAISWIKILIDYIYNYDNEYNPDSEISSEDDESLDLDSNTESNSSFGETGIIRPFEYSVTDSDTESNSSFGNLRGSRRYAPRGEDIIIQEEVLPEYSKYPEPLPIYQEINNDILLHPEPPEYFEFELAKVILENNQ